MRNGVMPCHNIGDINIGIVDVNIGIILTKITAYSCKGVAIFCVNLVNVNNIADVSLKIQPILNIALCILGYFIAQHAYILYWHYKKCCY